MILNRTMGVANKLIEDIEKLLYYTTIIVQSIFFAYYGYSIYTNLNKLVLLLIFSLLFVLSVVGFIYFLLSYRKKSENHVKKVNKVFRIFKYVINGSMIILNLFEVTRYGGSEFAYMLIIFSSASLGIQIIVEFLRKFVTFYIDLFNIAFDKDFAFLKKIGDYKDVHGNLLRIVESPLGIIAKTKDINTQESTKNEHLVEMLAAQNKEKAISRKKKKYQENAIKTKTEIKGHLTVVKNRIFKRKDKNLNLSSEEEKKKVKLPSKVSKTPKGETKN